MVIMQKRSKRKPTGGRYKGKISKKKNLMGRAPSRTTVEKVRKRSVRTLGGNRKSRLLSINKVNLTDSKTKKTSVTDLKTILENPANMHFVRRNIMTKGALIETPKGKARITNRPSQDGFVNAVLMNQ